MEGAIFKQGAWEIGPNYIRIYYEQGPWEIKSEDIESIFEEIKYVGIECVYEISVQAKGQTDIWPLGKLGPENYVVRDALLEFSGTLGIPYRAKIQSQPTSPQLQGTASSTQQVPHSQQVPYSQQVPQSFQTPYAQPSGRIVERGNHRPPKSKKGLLIIGGLLIFGVIGFFILSNGGDEGGKGIVVGREKNISLAPSEKSQQVNAGGVFVTLPGGTIAEKTELTVKRVKDAPPLPEGGDGVSMQVYDIKFTTEQKVIGVAEIELPYDKSALPAGANPEKNVGALYFNPETSAWEGIPYKVNAEKGTVVITTDHFSTYASVVLKNGSKGLEAKLPAFVYVPIDFYDDETLNKIVKEGNSNAKVGKTALVKGWDKFNELYNITGQGSTLIEKTLELEGLAKVNDLMNNIGLGFALAQLAYDLYSGEKQDAAINLTKNTMYYSISKWGSRGLNIMGVGLFAIDYSINQMGTQVKQTNYENWKKAYDLFYNTEKRRGARAWYEIIMATAEKAKSQQEFQDMIVKEVDDYLNLFWQDEEVMARYIAEVKGSFVKGAGGGGLAMAKEDVTAVAKQELYTSYLPVALNCAMKNLAFNTQMKAEKELDKLKAEFNKTNTVVIQAGNIDKVPNVKNVKVRFINQKDELIHEMTLDSEGKATLRMTMFGFLQSGSPNKVEVYIPSDGKSEDRTINLTYKFKNLGDTLVIPVNLGFSIYGTWKVKNVSSGFSTSWTFSEKEGGIVSVTHLSASTKNFKYSIKDGKINLVMSADYATRKGGKKDTHEDITINGTISTDGNTMTTQATTKIKSPAFPKGYSGTYKIIFSRKTKE